MHLIVLPLTNRNKEPQNFISNTPDAMKVKTFISQSSHKTFFDLINKLLEHAPIEAKDGNEMIGELHRQKEVLEQIYVQYNGKFDELHRLIAEYQVQQIQIRKKIRQIQLDNKDKKESNYILKKRMNSDSSFQTLFYLLINIFLFDDAWKTVLGGL